MAVLVLAVGAVGTLWATGVVGRTESSDSDAYSSAPSSASARSGSADTTSSAADDNDGAAETLSSDETYELLSEEWVALGKLGKRIGNKANETGFAYDVFGKHIDNANQSLVRRCRTFLKETKDQELTLRNAQIDTAYESDREALLRLYGFAEERIDAMLQASIVSADGGTSQDWLAKLQPRSGNAREAFDEAYASAEPSHR